MKLPKNFKKSYKFFCLGLDIRVKKKMAALLAAALAATNILPVMAYDETTSGSVAEENYQEISDTKQAGSTTVVANVQAVEPGSVAYIVSVPSYVDFGSLERNEEYMGQGVEWNRVITGDVKLTTVEGLDTANQRIAVLVQDAENGTAGFKMNGASGTALTAGKTLNYKIYAGQEPNQYDLENTTTVYSNGFLVGAFANENDTVNLTFKLNQNQMTGELDQWAGTYQGTLTFYSKVAGVSDYN
jgi:hypothetical protein